MKNDTAMTRKENTWGWIFVAPAVVLISVLVFWPMFQALLTSFQTGTGEMTWVGVK
ncbi:MAG: sugar ABC transporter permease, partial [Erysipelotrichaceae bacterium]|nr:sugar ABC transporter permease [Erysipelotrichaceae bacterium]